MGSLGLTGTEPDAGRTRRRRSARQSGGVVATRWFTTFLLSCVAFAALYPLFYTVVTSFKSNVGFAQDPLGLPSSISWENYIEFFKRVDLLRLLFNSLVVTIGGVVLMTVAALLLSYVITKMRFRGSIWIFAIVIASLTIPSQAIIYPLYDTVLRIHLVGRYEGLILAFAAFGLPLGTYMLSAYFSSIPDELVEAARMDGASHVRILFSILLPVSAPAIATLAIFNFVWMWNDLLLPLVLLGGSDKKTLMVGVALLSGQYDVSIPLVSAGLIITMIPMLIVYLFFQRHLTAGALAGVSK